jgi:hypothetical protein
MIPRRPGEYVRRRHLRLAIPLIALIGVGVVLAFVGTQWRPLSIVGLAMVLGVGWVSGAGRKLDPTPWLKGALGEEEVGRILAELWAEGYFDLHDIDTGRGNIDHVVIGPTGVVAVETKHWNGNFVPIKGRLYFNGSPTEEPLRQAQRAAIMVAERLAAADVPTFVEAVVVSTRGSVAKGQLRFRRATVLQPDRLNDWIRARPNRLTPQQVTRARAAILRWDAPVTVTAISHEPAAPSSDPVRS